MGKWFFMQRFVIFLSWAYLMGLLILPVVWAWRGEGQWLLALLRYSPAMVYVVPTALLGLVAFLLKCPGCRLPLVVSLGVIFLVYASPVFNFKRHAPGQIRVVTYNILSGKLDEKEQLAQFLQAQDADVILLQEAFMAPFREDPVEPIKRHLTGYRYVRGGDIGELAIFTKHPILEHQTFSLSSRRPALWADIDLGGRRTRVFNVHYDHFDEFGTRHVRTILRSTARARANQTARLVEQLGQWDGPTILAGDFNCPPNSDTSQRVRARLQDSYATVGTGLGQTFPSFFPLWRIDYVYASRHFAVRGSGPVDVTWSDHKPLRAELDPL